MKTIAITISTEEQDFTLRRRYTDLIMAAAEACGIPVLPVLLPNLSDPALAREYARMFDGFLITGGGDVSPDCYGEERLPKCGKSEAYRDPFELSLIRAAFESGKPTFGICRGIQAMNVALGGTLWQDLPSQCPDAVSHNPSRHTVHLDGILRDVVGSDAVITNSYHHQAVKVPGRDLLVTARCEDGIIEGIAHSAHPYYRAVQWHPEIDPDTVSHRLFVDFLSHLGSICVSSGSL